MKVHPFCVILLILMEVASALASQPLMVRNESYLIRQILMKNYDPLARPVTNSSELVYLTMTIRMKNLIQLDMKKQTLMSFCWLVVNWYDQFLRWDLNEFSVKEVHLTANMVWHPDLVIFNTVSDLDQLEDQKMKVIVEHTGKVTWYPGGLFQTFCSVDISRFPLDTQTCSVEVVSWSSNRDVLNATVVDPVFAKFDTTEDHPEWRLIGNEAAYTVRPSNFWIIRFRFTLKRKVMFYILNMILPIILLSFMNCLVFLLPVESGEKMTVSVTIFLSFAVFLTLINESLPQNSDSVCLFSVYVAVQMFLSVCSVVMAAYIVIIYVKDRNPSSTPQCHSSPSLHGETSSDVSIDSVTATSSKSVLNPESAITTNAPISSIQSSNWSEPTLPPTEIEKVGSDVKTRNGEEEARARGPSGSVSLTSVQEHQGCLSLQQVWLMVARVHHLTPEQRRLLSRHLDKICFVFNVSVNLLLLIVFCCLFFVP